MILPFLQCPDSVHEQLSRLAYQVRCVTHPQHVGGGQDREKPALACHTYSHPSSRFYSIYITHIVYFFNFLLTILKGGKS
jgi:hypothetical protein